MTVTRILYILVSCNVLWSVIQAYQPDGYLGCLEDNNGNSLKNIVRKYFNSTNNGDVCKAHCKYHTNRYAGTKGGLCYCGSGVVQSRNRSSTQCNQPCPGNLSETCGGEYDARHYNRMLLYDTWLCITRPCQNGATCTDIHVESYNCSCSVGWTGRICNETVTTTTYTISPSSITQASGSSTVVALPEGNKLAIYIAVPVSIVVIIVFVLVVTVLIIRKRLSRNRHGRKAVYQTSANTSHSEIAVANNSYNDHDIIPLETSVNVHATEDAATGDSEHSYFTLEQTGDGSRSYNNADQRSGSAIQNDDNSYGHLHDRATALCDPTYSHTTTTGSQGNTDYTYSHMDHSAGNKNHGVISNIDHDTYNTCNMKGDVGKLRPAMEIQINDTDDTYNILAISGKATNINEKHTASSVNGPDYDHTDVKNH